jgi:hypothetical protein
MATDPSLSDSGRAGQVARRNAQGHQDRAIFTTEFKRTQETAAPPPRRST